MDKVVSFGEVLMRLSPSSSNKLGQVNSLDYFFGGTEFNVAVSLSRLGMKTQHVSCLSDDFIGEAAIEFIRMQGVGYSYIKRLPHPLGVYFMEAGAAIRPSRISYNRLHSAFANIQPDDFNWSKILKDSKFFHWTGITPGISQAAYETLKVALQNAKQKGLCITCDPSYRKNLWNYGKNGKNVLFELVSMSTIFIGGVSEMNEILGTTFPHTKNGFIEASKRLIENCPGIVKVFDKIRKGGNVSWQLVQGRSWNGIEYLETEEIEISHVVDRIGTGDAFAAGIIYGLSNFDDLQTLQFANAAFAIKHSIMGDINLAKKEEIIDIMNGDLNGKIKR